MKSIRIIWLLVSILLIFSGCTPQDTNTDPNTVSSATDNTITEKTSIESTTHQDLQTTPEHETVSEKEYPDTTDTQADCTSLDLEKAVIKFSLLKKENPMLYSDAVFTITKDKIIFSAPYMYNMQYFNACTPTVALAEGIKINYTDDCTNKDGSLDLLSENAGIVITDMNGVQMTYPIITERKILSLPIIELTTEADISDISRNIYSPAVFSLSNSDQAPLENLSASIRGRGHSTWNLEKKPYKIKFNEPVSILGLQAKKDWVLLANHADKSLIRNTVAHKLSEQLNGIEFKLHQYPIDLFINGEYQGVYSIGEHIEASSGRIDIDENYLEADTGYLLECGGVDDEDIFGKDYFHTQTIKFLRIKSPDTEIMSQENFNFIKDYLNNTDNAIRTLDGYEEYIDVDSFIDWFILHELTYNLDSCYRRSCYMYKDKGEKLKMSPVWDFDLAMGNFSYDNPRYDDFVTVGASDDDSYIKITWFNYLLEDESFRAKLKVRFDEVGEKLYDTAVKTIDEYYLTVSPSAECNFKIWDILDKKVGFQPNSMKKQNTYEKQISYLKDFIKMRFEYLQDNI